MREFFQSSFQLTEAPADDGRFKGYASVFNVEITDTWIPTIIRPGAFAKTLQEQGDRVKILYQHDPGKLIGKPLSMVETQIGLEVEGKISPTPCGLEALQLMRDGVLTDLSIGWDPIKFTITERPGQDPLREIHELRLWEFSSVTWGASRPARVTEVYSAELGRMIDGLIAGEQRPGVREALERFAAESTGTRLLHGIAGDLVVTDELALNRYIEMLSKADPDEALRLGLGALLFSESFAGAVLSAKNKQLVTSARDALQALLDAAEPKSADTDAASLTARSTLAHLALAELDHRAMLGGFAN